MADGSPDDCTGLKQMNELTFSALDSEHSDRKKCSEKTVEDNTVKLSSYTKLESSESCEKSDSRGVAANHSAAPESAGSQNPRGTGTEDGEDRKKRCFDRYDSSESSDSGIAVLSPRESGESGASSGSDITEPRSPRSPESGYSGCSAGEEGGGCGARMPPWSHSEPAPAHAPPAPPARRLAPQPPNPNPTRRPNPTLHRRITEFFNHKMKPQTGKREAATPANDDTKRKCLPKNGVTHDLEKYISYLSQTLSPKVMHDVKQSEAGRKATITNGSVDSRATDLSKKTVTTPPNGLLDYSIPKDNKDKNHMNMNGFVNVRHGTESLNKDKMFNGVYNGLTDHKKVNPDRKVTLDPSANGFTKHNKQITDLSSKLPISAASDLSSLRIPPAAAITQSPKISTAAKHDSKMNGVVSSTTKFDTRMNSVTCGSNNISLSPTVTKTTKPTPNKKEAVKKTQAQPTKRTNRKSSACIANSKNLTWSKANNLKQQVQQLQKQNCMNTTQLPGSPVKSGPEANTAPNMGVPNGVRQVSMTMNDSLGNLNMPINNIPNCHPVNIPQPCNGTVTSTHLQSFVAVPQNVMLTTLRIPQNGMQPQTINQPNGLNTFNRQNVNGVNGVNVSSPTKLNGPFMFPFVHNMNGTVVQIPNLMAAKVSNFVLPHSPQLAPQRQDHLQNQQAAQILINGTLLKLANNMASSYSNMNKPVTATSQSIPVMNKNVTGLPTIGMTVPPKPNYTVNLSHPVLVPQPGFIVTSVPNMNVKETWSYTGTNSVLSSQITCSTPMVHHPPHIVTSISTQTAHSSNIPIAPVKPPDDNPIQGTDPPSSTVKEPEINEAPTAKCDVPWLSKTVNNNILPLDSKIPTRAFSQVSSLLSNKFDEKIEKEKDNIIEDVEKISDESRSRDKCLRQVEEVARREDTIFTQITVLKDVSSNVQNAVIEANFCSASSESGIGTDKSIASPSDSQTSKECDEDSSLSLNVSVCEDVVSSQKSPILKQPKTLRFPPRNPVKTPGGKRTSSTDTTATVLICMWEECKNEFENDTDLLEHLQSTHVDSQAGRENYVCRWEGCKVRGKPSCSRLWLERHALSHGGNKPFKCIVDGCERRFSTQILLERHVNNHFTGSSPNAGAGKKTAEGSGAKLIRRNGKKLRYRRQPWSARMFDFFDAGMMEGLAWRLSRCTRWRLGGSCPLREPPGRHTLTLHAALAATRYNAQAARREALITYYPPNVLEDEWVPEKDVKSIKRVEIASLPAETKVFLYEQFTASYRKAASPPPVKKDPPQPAPTPAPARTLPPRQCTSARLLNNLLKKKEPTPSCSATNVPIIYREDESPSPEKTEVTGAKKRKMGRRHGGTAFWPCGR